MQTELTLGLQLWQKSLVVDLEASEPVSSGVSLGRADGLTQPQLFPVPYLTFQGSDPRIMYTKGLFYLTMFDWYRSDASELYGAVELWSDWARFNCGARYLPLTDVRRNPVR